MQKGKRINRLYQIGNLPNYGLRCRNAVFKSMAWDSAAWTGAMVSLKLGGRAGIPLVEEYGQNDFSDGPELS